MRISDVAMDSRARRAAKRVGLCAIKSRRLRGTVNNLGDYRLIDPMCNAVVAGERFDLTAEEVIEVCS